LSLIQSEWKPKMDWAIKIAYHEGPVDDETWGGSRTSPGEIKSEVEDDDGTLHAHIDILASLTPALD
jgi:hypothetical protein